jgi:hypothetical protein
MNLVKGDYLRAPRCGLRSWLWRRFEDLRLGLLMMNVPLPMYFVE